MGMIERFFETIEKAGITPYEIETKLGVKSAQSKISQMKEGKTKGGKEKTLSSDILSAICFSREDINPDYILTGRGKPLKMVNEISNNKVNASGNSNVSSVYNNGQSIIISLPKSGTQKIIKPDGSVEIQSLSSSADTDRLNQRIQDLERIILEKDATIKSKDETIWALRTMLDRQ